MTRTLALFLALTSAALADVEISTRNLPMGTVGVQYSATLTASDGTPPYLWSLAEGSLPPGLNLGLFGQISGIPSAAGDFRFEARVTDLTLDSDRRGFTIQIRPVAAEAPLVITTASFPAGTVGSPYSQTLAASGGTAPYTWSLRGGILPAGLSLETATGRISGTPSQAGPFDFTVQVQDSTSAVAERSFRIDVAPAPMSITTTALAGGTVGSAYAGVVSATGGTPPYTWSISAGALPGGLTLNSANGGITGTPTTAGTFDFTVLATDTAGGTASRNLRIVVAPAPVSVTTQSLAPGQVGQPYSANLAASGGTPPYSWALAGGALPTGLSLAPSGTIQGTPSSAGTFNFTVRVTDANNATATRDLQIVVAGPALSIATESLPPGQVGQPYSVNLNAFGGTQPYSWALAGGALPAGLSLTPAGTIQGTPSSAGTFNFTVRVTDANNATATRDLQIAVSGPALSISTDSLPGGQVGQPYSANLTASGGTAPYSWALAGGALPAGLSLAPSGTIQGTPSSAGTFNFSVRVTDAAGVNATRNLAITIGAQPISIETGSLPSGRIGDAYSASLAASGGSPPYVWTIVDGALPAGLTLSSGGQISGTPTSPGSFSFTVQAADAAQLTATRQYTITIAATPLSITTSALPDTVAGAAYLQTLTAAGGTPPLTWSVAGGTLPPGLSLDRASGRVTGTASEAGQFSFTVRVTDSANLTAEKPLAIRVDAALSAGGCPAVAATRGQPYSATLSASGGRPPYQWAVASGQLPPGLSLDAVTGTISGLPVTPGSYSAAFRVTDAAGQSRTLNCTITVGAPVAITTTTLPDGTVGSPYFRALSATGGTPPYSWSIVSGSLPPGLSLAPAGALSGTPTQPGVFGFTVRVTDASGGSADRSYSVTIATGLTIANCPTPAAMVGRAYQSSVAAAGGQPPLRWSINGTLPAGIVLGESSGAFSGTPSQEGQASFTLQVTDSAGGSATRACSINVAAALSITKDSLLSGSVGVPYTDTFTASGGIPPYVWTVSAGSLPPGLLLNGADGRLNGTPSQAGSFPFTILVSDASGNTATRSFTATIASGMTISACPAPNGFIGEAYESSTPVSGGEGPFSWGLASGNLPEGLVLNSGTGTVSGTPVRTGTFSFSLRVTGRGSLSATRACTISVGTPSLRIASGDALPDGVIGSPYRQTLTASGGSAPYAWSIADGALPRGITLGPDGALSGTPQVSGSFVFSVRVSDATRNTVSRALRLRILPGAFPGISFIGTPEIVRAAEQPSIRVVLDSSYPAPISGRLLLTFEPDPGLPDDPAIQFSTGGREVAFSVGANATDFVFPSPLALQTGTVAGVIRLEVRMQSEGLDVTPSPAPQRSLRVDRTAPVITGVQIVRSGDGFEVRVTGHSTTREVSRGVFRFVPAAGSSLENSEIAVELSDASRVWFENAQSVQFGGQFLLVQPFSVRDASLQSVSVTLTNGQGTSQAMQASF